MFNIKEKAKISLYKDFLTEVSFCEAFGKMALDFSSKDRPSATTNDDEWIQEAVVRFLQGPCYTTPLMGFIDTHCIIFDTEVRIIFHIRAVSE